MRRTVSIFLFLILCTLANAQVKKTDSLLKLLSSVKEDTSKVLLYLRISAEFENSQPSKAIIYGKKALQLSQKINFNTGTISAFKNLGYLHAILGDYDATLFHYKESLREARRGNDSLKVGIALFNIGSAYRYQSDFKTAITYMLEAYQKIEPYQDKRVLAQVNNGLQLLYYYLPNYEKAVFYGEKAVNLARELKDDDLLLMALSNLSMSYKDMDRLDKSASLLDEALKLAKRANDINAEATVLLNMAGVYLEKRDYRLLEHFAQKSLTLNQQIQSKEGECISLRALAICYLQNKNYQQAMFFIEDAYKIAHSNNYKIEKASCLKVMSNIAFATQDVEKGELYFKESEDLTQEIFKESYMESTAMYEKKYEVEKKNKQLLLQEATLAKRAFLIKSLIGSTMTLLVVFLSVYFYYKSKQKLQAQKIRELEKEKQLAATEAVLKGEAQERSRLAKDLHDGLGGMLSGIKYSFQTMKGNLIMTPENQQAFERSMDMLDSSIKEMRRVAHNMMPESLVRFGLDTALKDYCTSVSKSGALQVSYQSIGLANYTFDQTMAISIYRIIQELIGNTLKHGAAKNAIVQVTKSDNLLAVTVEDDGKGFDTNMIELSKGIGYTNIKHRVDFLKGKLDINSEEGKGTSVHIEFEI
ncbi:MAG: sensor histidine kinase [Confluentibacter sp.]|nr:sensor histidine kinase [Confluentibacter sp.]